MLPETAEEIDPRLERLYRESAKAATNAHLDANTYLKWIENIHKEPRKSKDNRLNDGCKQI